MLRLVFLGDFCTDVPPSTVTLPFLGDGAVVVGNLEGAIVEDISTVKTTTWAPLYSGPQVVDALRAFRVSGVDLANNHIGDIRQGAQRTRAMLRRAGIAAFGAGRDRVEALEPYVVDRDGIRVRVYGFSWKPIGGRAATPDREGFAPFEPECLFATLRRARSEDPRAVVIFIVHWNYELEVYPQPAHRELAAALLEAGVDAVIGHHPHVCGGAERLGGKPIAYSLGNWFFTKQHTGPVRFTFPPRCHLELAVELQVSGPGAVDARFHWCWFDSARSTVDHEGTETWGGERLCQQTPFDGLDYATYGRWFAHYRIRRGMLPIYHDYHQDRINAAKDTFLRARHSAIQALLMARVKAGPGFKT